MGGAYIMLSAKREESKKGKLFINKILTSCA